jgi:glycosyltransferase involved in cell wall biosynthesis
MWCGRLSPEKRPIEAIKAVASIKGATLDIYGSGPSEKDLREYIKEHKLASRIRLKGRVEQDAVLKAMQDHDVLIYSSYGYDNQPMVLLEAVAAGIPIVYCDPDLTECMPKGGGLLTDDISEETLKNALTDLQDNPQRLQAMREKLYDNRDKVRQSYHSKKMVTLYKRLTKHNAK